MESEHRLVGERFKADQFERLQVHESMGERLIANGRCDKVKDTMG
jgi:hypothetical protein